ncbi:MAG TPA: DUF1656 domain-containing protein [Aliidongia sp.]|nr:DUF1656 domain-containing protein [Aliidongia sp.]
MRYIEVDIFGVYVAPFMPMMVAAWLVTLPLRLLFDRFGLTRGVWHPALFNAALYVAVLSLIVLAVGNR